MKHFFFYSVLMACVMSTQAQTSVQPVTTKAQAVGDKRWDLDKYVWSHTNYKTGKDDKPVIDFDVIDHWVSLTPDEYVSISDDGKYLAYGIQTHNPVYQMFDTLVVQSTENRWRQAFAFRHNPFQRGFFSSDNKQYIYQDGDSLCFIQTGSDQHHYAKGMVGYKLPGKGSNEWLAYQLNDNDKTVVLQHFQTGQEIRFRNVRTYSFDKSRQWFTVQLNNAEKELVIYNLINGKEQKFPIVDSYVFSSAGNALLLKDSNGLQYINLKNGTLQSIWSAKDSSGVLGSYSLDESGKQAVFVLSIPVPNINPYKGSQQDDKDNAIWYWKEGMGSAAMKVTSETTGIDAGMFIQGAVSFTDNGRYIQFPVQPRQEYLSPLPEKVPLDVWDYRDTILQSVQLNRLKEPATKTYNVIFDPQTGKLLSLEDEHKKVVDIKGDFAVIRQTGIALHGDRFWETDYHKDSCWLVFLRDGSRQFLVRGQANDSFVWFSPGGNYLVYFDAERGCSFYSYDLRTGKQQAVPISVGVPEGQLGYKDYNLRTIEKPTAPAGIACWLKDDNGLLVYDAYDIWRLDPAGKKAAVNLTNGYGRLHNTVFRLMKSDMLEGNILDNVIRLGSDGLVLSAFNRQNKFNGFYLKKTDKKGDPDNLSMGPWFMAVVDGIIVPDPGMIPLKAANADTWIVRRQTATEAPNYFVTKDFKGYTALINLQQQKKYNWLTAELHSFKQPDGTMSQGVLYKPENFDPGKKYPVIVSFYTRLSDYLYHFPDIDYMLSPILAEYPAWMVSHGYLVFLPDIQFIQGKYGPSTVNSLEGAARYLHQLPYVDGSHIGAVGHSNSGRFGYYLLTHSHSFAAMSLSSGFGGTDIMSVALSLTKSGDCPLQWAEDLAFGAAGARGLGNLWQNKATWIDHIAVLQADHVTSPLLLLHNKGDGDDIRLAEELYISLRRLEKRAWWLQYDQGAHQVQGRSAKDFTIRYTQFFDHYLKGAPAPLWMTQGLPAKYKTIESRFELDPQGSCGRDCEACRKVNARKTRP